MPAYLSIHVHLLGGHYHGEEWPPAPMRLMQAIVAGSARAGYLDEEHEAIGPLQWLEALSPPLIHTPNVDFSAEFTAYVPRNSDDLTLRSLYRDKTGYEAQIERRSRYDAQPTRRRWTSEPIIYEWEVDNVSKAEQLGRLSHELTCLGRAEDLAFARFAISDKPREAQPSTWHPYPDSGITTANRLRIPVPGSFESLRFREQARSARTQSRAYVDSEPLYDEKIYVLGSPATQRPYLLYDLRETNNSAWLSWRHNEGVTVAAMIRHALNQVDATHRGYALGHIETGDLDARLSWIPLPSLGHEYVDGRIRRVMILGAAGESLSESPRFREVQHILSYASLEQHGRPVGRLIETDVIDNAIRPYLDKGVHWRTVTPVVVPGRTSCGARRQGKFDRHKAEKLILRSLARAGLPNPIALHFQAAPFERAGRAAREYRVPGHLANFSRFHISMTFSEPIEGPLIVGAGRHYGLGLFRTAIESSVHISQPK